MLLGEHGTSRMSQPAIRYAQTPDGIRLAYVKRGSGSPIIYLPSLVSDIQNEWKDERGKVYERLSRHHMLVRYDGRGHGLSTRNPEELSLGALVDDLRTIVDALGFERVDLFAPTVSGAVAVAFAAMMPERVSHLILWRAFPSFYEYFQSSIKGALPLANRDWDLFTLTAAHVRVGWLRGEQARQAATLLRNSVSQEFYLRELELAKEIDGNSYLADVRAPTLVMCRRDFEQFEVESSKNLAATVPGARLVLLEGSTSAVYNEQEDVVRQVEDFLGDSGKHAARRQSGDVRVLSELTPRETEILRYVTEGHRNKEIAARLDLSVFTVSRHVATIYEKLGVHGRAEATRQAIGLGLVPPFDSFA